MTGGEIFSLSSSLYTGWKAYTHDGGHAVGPHKHTDPHLYLGVVEDNNDPRLEARVKVRIYGVHSGKNYIAEKDLPWIHVMSPTTSAGIDGLGCNPYILAGSHVMLHPVGKKLQQFIVVGTLPTYTYGVGFDQSKGFCDATQEFPRIKSSENRNNSDYNDKFLAMTNANFDSAELNKFFHDPGNDYHPEYPYNQVYETTSGHIKEFDDTSGHERIRERHKSGTEYEIQSAGTKVTRVVGNNYELIAGDDFLEVHGTVTIKVSKDCKLDVTGKIDINSASYIAINAESSLFINSSNEIDIRAVAPVNLYSYEKINIQAEDQINIIAKPGGYCKALDNGKTNYFYSSEGSCLRANDPSKDPEFEWIENNEADITLSANNDITLMSKNGQIILDGPQIHLNKDRS